jgi:hypothetical protein
MTMGRDGIENKVGGGCRREETDKMQLLEKSDSCFSLFFPPFCYINACRLCSACLSRREVEFVISVLRLSGIGWNRELN